MDPQTSELQQIEWAHGGLTRVDYDERDRAHFRVPTRNRIDGTRSPSTYGRVDLDGTVTWKYPVREHARPPRGYQPPARRRPYATSR